MCGGGGVRKGGGEEFDVSGWRFFTLREGWGEQKFQRGAGVLYTARDNAVLGMNTRCGLKATAFRGCSQCLKPYKLLLVKSLSVLIYSLTISIQRLKYFWNSWIWEQVFKGNYVSFALFIFLVCPGGWGILLRGMSQIWDISTPFLILARGKDISVMTNWKFNIYLPMPVRLPGVLLMGCCPGPSCSKAD